MCFGGGGLAQETIHTDQPLAEVAGEYGLPVSDGSPPGAVDLADPTLQAARQSAKLRAAMGYNRQSTFLTGPNGDTSPPKLGTPTALGGG